jgi:predicted ester cyclase
MEASEQNKATAQAVFEIWNTGETERLDALVASHVVHHDPHDPNSDDGLVGLKRTIERNREAFPDIHLTVEDQVAEGDKVATRWRGEMTHTGKIATSSADSYRRTYFMMVLCLDTRRCGWRPGGLRTAVSRFAGARLSCSATVSEPPAGHNPNHALVRGSPRRLRGRGRE